MIKKAVQVLAIILFPLHFLLAEDTATTLEMLVEAALAADRDTIQARRYYETSLIDQKYSYLQWWMSSFGISHDLIYPYENDEFDDVFTGDTTALSLSLPLPTGTAINFGSTYALCRELLDTSLPNDLHWGYRKTCREKSA